MKKKGLDLPKQKFHPHQLRRIWSKALDEVERQCYGGVRAGYEKTREDPEPR